MSNDPLSRLFLVLDAPSYANRFKTDPTSMYNNDKQLNLIQDIIMMIHAYSTNALQKYIKIVK